MGDSGQGRAWLCAAGRVAVQPLAFLHPRAALCHQPQAVTSCSGMLLHPLQCEPLPRGAPRYSGNTLQPAMGYWSIPGARTGRCCSSGPVLPRVPAERSPPAAPTRSLRRASGYRQLQPGSISPRRARARVISLKAPVVGPAPDKAPLLPSGAAKRRALTCVAGRGEGACGVRQHMWVPAL